MIWFLKLYSKYKETMAYFRTYVIFIRYFILYKTKKN